MEFLGFLIFLKSAGGFAAAVLDQVFPDVFLVSSKADDRFIDLCCDSSMNLFFSSLLLLLGAFLYAYGGAWW